jgi:hypothetical protein
MKPQRNVKISIYGNGTSKRSELKGKHKHVNKSEFKSNLKQVNKSGNRIGEIIVMTCMYRVEINRKRMTKKDRVYKMYGNRNNVQQVHVSRYREYVFRNIGLCTNTASTSVQKNQYVCMSNTGCIEGEKEKRNVKICDKSVNVISEKSVKCRYVIVICCCKKSALVHKMWSMAQRKKQTESKAMKCRKVKICIARKRITKYRVPIRRNVELLRNVVLLTGGYICSRCRYKLKNVNPFPAFLKMDTQSKGDQGKEEDVEMADPALTGLASVFTPIVSGIYHAVPV